MAERTEELTRTRPTKSAEASEESSSSLTARLRPSRPSLPRVFDPRFFLLSLVVTLIGLFVGGFALPIGPLGSLAGLGISGFVLGLVANGRRYLEVGAAGAIVSGVSALLGNLILSVAGLGVPLALFGASAGFGLAVVGFYIGRDLKNGVTKEL